MFILLPQERILPATNDRFTRQGQVQEVLPHPERKSIFKGFSINNESEVVFLVDSLSKQSTVVA